MENASSLARDMIAEAGRTGALLFVVVEAARSGTWRGLLQGGRLAWAVLRA